MPAIDEQVVTKVVSEVLNRLRQQQLAVAPTPSAPPVLISSASSTSGSHGVYDDMNAACDAAQRSFDKLRGAGVTASSAHPADELSHAVDWPSATITSRRTRHAGNAASRRMTLRHH